MKHLILIVIFSIIVQQNGFTQGTEFENWKLALIESIKLEVGSQVNKGCLKDSTFSTKFFKNELIYFPIEIAFQKAKEVVTTRNLKKSGYLVLELYYPQVGFDPEIGYRTILITKQRLRKPIIEEFDIETNQFQIKSGKLKYLKKSMSKKSDCYGTGYLFITVFDKDLSIKNIKILLSLELINKNAH